MTTPERHLTEITLTVALTDEEVAAVDAEVQNMRQFCGADHPTFGVWDRQRVLALWLEIDLRRACDQQITRTQMMVRAEQQLERR